MYQSVQLRILGSALGLKRPAALLQLLLRPLLLLQLLLLCLQLPAQPLNLWDGPGEGRGAGA